MPRMLAEFALRTELLVQWGAIERARGPAAWLDFRARLALRGSRWRTVTGTLTGATMCTKCVHMRRSRMPAHEGLEGEPRVLFLLSKLNMT